MQTQVPATPGAAEAAGPTSRGAAPARVPSRPRGPLRPALALALAALLPLAAPVPALAQAPQSPPGGAGPAGPAMMGPQAAGRINVTGEGEVRGAPDMATVTLGVTSSAENAAAAMSANSAQVGKLIDTLKAGGVAPADIQTSGLSLNPQWVNDQPRQPGDTGSGGAPRIAGYQVSNTVTVQVRKLDDLGALLDRMVSTGANQLNGLSFGLSNPKPAQSRARRMAVADAISTAREMARAAGYELGPVVEMTEGGTVAPPQPMFRRMAAAMDAAVPVEGGEVGTTAHVDMTFALGKPIAVNGPGAGTPGKGGAGTPGPNDGKTDTGPTPAPEVMPLQPGTPPATPPARP